MVGSLRTKGSAEISFEVRHQDLWPRRVEKLRLDLATESGEPIAISRIEAVKSVPRPDLAPYLTADNWKVELDHDVRNAVLTVSGKEISWMIFRSGPLRLRFSYGKLAVGASALRFRVSQAVPDGPRTTLFEEILDSSKSGDSDRWHEAEVELESTRKVRTIIFESGPVDTDTLDGVAVWANPELVPVEGSSVQPSIVLISLDTLRADRLSLYGYPETTSPNLKKWAEEDAIVFLNAVAAAPRTLPSMPLSFRGSTHSDTARTSTALFRRGSIFFRRFSARRATRRWRSQGVASCIQISVWPRVLTSTAIGPIGPVGRASWKMDSAWRMRSSAETLIVQFSFSSTPMRSMILTCRDPRTRIGATRPQRRRGRRSTCSGPDRRAGPRKMDFNSTTGSSSGSGARASAVLCPRPNRICP